MKQEEKELLLKDLSARLPYNVAIDCKDEDSRFTCYLTTDILKEIQNNTYHWEYKPYLFPLSSMTEEQIFLSHFGYETMDVIRRNKDWTMIEIHHDDYYELTDWLNAHHFDYRGLIPMGLANDATGLNIY